MPLSPCEFWWSVPYCYLSLSHLVNSGDLFQTATQASLTLWNLVISSKLRPTPFSPCKFWWSVWYCDRSLSHPVNSGDQFETATNASLLTLWIWWSVWICDQRLFHLVNSGDQFQTATLPLSPCEFWWPVPNCDPRLVSRKHKRTDHHQNVKCPHPFYWRVKVLQGLGNFHNPRLISTQSPLLVGPLRGRGVVRPLHTKSKGRRK